MPGEFTAKHESRVAGAAGGTFYVALLQLIPKQYHWLEDWLAFFAPTLAIAGAFAWGYVRLTGAKWLTGRNLDKAIATAKKYRNEIHADPHSTAEHKEKAQRAVDDLIYLRFEALDENYRRFRAFLS